MYSTEDKTSICEIHVNRQFYIWARETDHASIPITGITVFKQSELLFGPTRKKTSRTWSHSSYCLCGLVGGLLSVSKESSREGKFFQNSDKDIYLLHILWAGHKLPFQTDPHMAVLRNFFKIISNQEIPAMLLYGVGNEHGTMQRYQFSHSLDFRRTAF